VFALVAFVKVWAGAGVHIPYAYGVEVACGPQHQILCPEFILGPMGICKGSVPSPLDQKQFVFPCSHDPIPNRLKAEKIKKTKNKKIINKSIFMT
jgi:hypothetical protein